MVREALYSKNSSLSKKHIGETPVLSEHHNVCHFANELKANTVAKTCANGSK